MQPIPMNDTHLAQTYFNELLRIARLNDGACPQLDALYLLVNRFILHQTREERLQFSTPFARISFLSHKYSVAEDTQWRMHEFRRKAQTVYFQDAPLDDRYFQLGFWAFAEWIGAVFQAELPAEVKALLPPSDFYPRDEVVVAEHKPKVRFMALDIAPDDHLLEGYDADEPARNIRVRYNETGRNEAFTPNIRSLQKSWSGRASLNLLDVDIDEAGVYHPRAIVIEPDYLMDVSAVAGCFSGTKAEPMLHLLKKFIPIENAVPLALGNVANFFLDELMTDPNLTFEETFPKVFQLNPLGFTTFESSDLKDLMDQSRTHFRHLKQMVRRGLREHDIDPDNCYLEPAFFSEVYGLQGRLDIWYEHPTNPQHSAIVELKSGKPFMPNNHGIGESHYMQALLYDLLIKSVYEQRDPRNYILYSREGEHPLRFAPAESNRQNEGLRVRNFLVSIEQQLINMHLDLESGQTLTILDQLSPHGLPDLKGFSKRDMQFFYDVLSQASAVERAYFLAFVSFTAREHQLAKIGVPDVDTVNGQAALWLSPFAHKDESFEILAYLRVQQDSLQVKADEPLITFEKSPEHTNPLANFRAGDIAILYPSDDPRSGTTALTHQVFKCTIIELSAETVTVRLRSKQFNDRLFREVERRWVLEHDMFDHSYNGMYQGLFAFLQAPQALRNRLLTISAPDVPQSAPADGFAERLPERMTEQQTAILRKAIAAPDYFLLWGPPGTGKTSVMLRNLVAHLYRETDEDILLLAYTNRAVDEICEAITGICDYIRIGSRYSTAPRFHGQLFNAKIASAKRRDALREVVTSHRVYVATVAAMASKQELFKLKQFDRVIIDEASQILEPMLVGLLPRFKRFILIGDHKQLPAVVMQDKAHSAVHNEHLRGLGLCDMRDSLFERLFLRCKAMGWEHAYDMLSYQGRMHEAIMTFPNVAFYEHHLHVLPDYCRVDQRSATAYALPEGADALLTHLSTHRMVYIDTPIDGVSRTRKTNAHEAQVVGQVVRAFDRLFQHNGVPWSAAHTLGVITPYRAQIAQVREVLTRLEAHYGACSVDTVERYQGSAREVIVLSLCVNDGAQLQSLVSLSTDGAVDRKLNVALTRARKHLVIVGNREILCQSPIYEALIAHIDAIGGTYSF